MTNAEIKKLKAKVKERHANGELIKTAMEHVAKELGITYNKVFYAYYKAENKIRKRKSPGFKAAPAVKAKVKEQATIIFDITSISIKNNKLIITVSK